MLNAIGGGRDMAEDERPKGSGGGRLGAAGMLLPMPGGGGGGGPKN